MTYNVVAVAALMTWPIIAIVLFSRFSNVTAVIWTFLGAHLLLPANIAIKFAMVPQIDKASVACLSALVGSLFFTKSNRVVSHRYTVVGLLIVIFLLGPSISALLNNDTLAYGGVVIPGTGVYDAGSALLASIITLVPFFLGRRFFKTTDDISQIFRCLALAGILYSPLLLLELRFSPQLNYWVYGYYASDYVQTLRSDSYRPMAFLGHGLQASFFILTTVIASAVLGRLNQRILGLPAWSPPVFLTLTLLLYKSAGALVYSVLLLPIVWFFRPRSQIRIAALLLLISLLYPVLRIASLVPTNLLVSTAATLSEDRAASLKFRFDNEEILLSRAEERIVFGWGRFGRSRVYDSGDGRDMSVTDGRWIITLGQFGIIGFLAEFMLLGFPIFIAAIRLRHLSNLRTEYLISGLALILAICILDLLPNGFLTPWMFLLSGALLGIVEVFRKKERRKSYVESIDVAPKMAK